jgi:hypothetical protein
MVLVLGLVFYFGPGAAYLAGARATEVDNRRLTAFPSVSDGWKGLPKLGTWATDHLPGRQRAVAANASVARDIFGEEPTFGSASSAAHPAVIQGRNDWLFFGADFDLRCNPHLAATETLTRLKTLSAAFTKSGRRFVFVIVPDKSSVYPKYLPRSFIGRSCSKNYNAEFWGQFDQQRPPGYADVRTTLIQGARNKEVLYRPSDTHFNRLGSSTYAQKLAATLDERLRVKTRVENGGKDKVNGDLATLLGTPKKDEIDDLRIAREGVTMTSDSNLALTNSITHVRNTSTGAPLYQPKTLMLGDSFTANAKTQVAPYFADLDLLENDSGMKNPANMAKEMTEHDTVVWEVAERTFITGRGVLSDRRVLDATLASLASHSKK